MQPVIVRDDDPASDRLSTIAAVCHFNADLAPLLNRLRRDSQWRQDQYRLASVAPDRFSPCKLHPAFTKPRICEDGSATAPAGPLVKRCLMVKQAARHVCVIDDSRRRHAR